MFHSILVPIDVEHESTYLGVVPVAARLARDHGAALHVLAVIPPVGSSLVDSVFPADFEQQLTAKVKEKLAAIVSGLDLEGVSPRLHLARGSVHEEILRAADHLGCDLVALAASRRGRSPRWLGPTAAHVMRHAEVSVLMVREPPAR